MTTNKALEVAREMETAGVAVIDQYGKPHINQLAAIPIIDQALQSERELADKLADALGAILPRVTDVNLMVCTAIIERQLAAYNQHREAQR